MSELWTSLFKRLRIELFYSTAYHPQTDGHSERTNQTAETMLRFFLATIDDPTEWIHCLPRIQSVLNNSRSSSTDQTPNEIAYGFTPNFAVDYIVDPDIDILVARVDAADALDFAVMNMKFYYNRCYTPMFLAPGKWALLRLHRGYNILSATNHKLDQQYASPFKVLERIGRLAYRLKIPDY